MLKRTLLAMFLLMLAVHTQAMAQTTATLSGLATDESGACWGAPRFSIAG